MAILSKEQFEKQYTQKVSSGVSSDEAVRQLAEPEIARRVRAGGGHTVRNGTALPEQAQSSKSAYNPMDDIMHMLEPKAPTQQKQYVTGNAALDAWRSSVNTLANERKEKEAKAKAEAEQKEYKQLQSQLDRIDANRAYVTTTEQNDALEKERASVVQRMREIDGGTTSTGLDERLKKLFAGTGLERLGSDVGAMRGLYEAGQKNRTAQYQQAYDELQPQIARAQTAYNEMRALYGEAGATAEYNVLKDLQRRSDAYKKVLDENIQQRATAATSEMANSLTETGGAKLEEAKQGLNPIGRLGVDAASAGLNMLYDAALGRFGGSTLSNAAMGLRSFGQTAQAAEASGTDIDRQIGAGVAAAAKTVITNGLVDGLAGLYGKGAADDIIETAVGKLGKTDAGKNALRVLAKSAGEGVEELVDAKLDPLVSLIYDNGEALKQKYGSGWQGYKEAAADDLYSALIGFALGAAGQGVSAAKGDYARANAEIGRKASATEEFKRGPLPYVEWNPDISAEERARIDRRNLETHASGENSSAPIQQPQTRTETQEGNFTPAAPTNVKQGGSDELNSALNLNSRDATAEAQKNTAPTQETGNEDQSVISKMRGAKPQLEQMQSVSSVTGNEIGQNGRIVDRLMNFVDRIGGKVARPGFGDVQITRSKIKSSMIGHGVGNAKIETFAAVPDVIANGQEIDHQANWKGRNYDTYVFAAPVDYRGQKTYVGVVVQKDSASNRYYLHEVLGEDGEVIFKNDTAPAPTPDGTSALSGDLETVVSAGAVNREQANPTSLAPVGDTGAFSPPIADTQQGVSAEDVSSTTSIPTTAQNVKSENGVKSGLGSKSPRARTSQTAETIAEADITSDERAAQLNKYVQKGRFDYVPDTNEKQTRRAEREIAREGWDKSAKDFHDAVVKGVMSDDLVARGAILLNNVSNSDATAETYLDIANDYIDLLHRAGKVLQAGKILQQLTPEGRLYLMEKTVGQINHALTKGQKKSIAKERLGKAYDRKAIRDTVDDYGVKLDEGLVDEYLKAKTDKQRNEIISQMQQSIADQIPTTFSEGFTALRYLNMLGNFKTQERNILGNTAMLVTTSTKNRVKAVGELTANLFRKNKLERTASIIVKPSLLKEATADFANVADIASGGDKHLSESRRFASEIEDKRTIFKVNGTWGKETDSNLLSVGARKVADKGAAALEGARKLTNWAMEAGDAIFLKANYADALGGWLQAHGIKSISEATQEQLDRGRAYAIKEAQEATFRDSNVVSDWVSRIGRGQNTPALARAAFEGVAPFRKTPANVAVRAIEYSPVGVAETIYKGVKAAKGEGTATDVINSAAKNVTGSALAVAGYFLAKAGLARGGEDDDKLDAFQTMQGKQDYSIRIGDTWLSLSQFAPTTIPFFMGVKFYELADGGQITLDDALGVLGCISDPMLDMSMLSGVNEALDAVSSFGGDSDALPKLLMNSIVAYLSQGITNTLMGQFEQASEKNRQTNYATGDNWLGKSAGYTWGKLTAKIPGIDYNQQDYVDAWGRTQPNGGPMMRAFNAFINPTYGSEDKTTYVDAELERIYAAGKNVDGFPNVFPQKASRSMEIAKGQTMTPDEYVQYSKERGSKSLELVRDFMESDEYKLLSDEQRATVISDLYSLAADRALKNVRAAHNIKHTSENKYLGVADENMPEYLATSRLFTDAKDSGGKSTYNALDDILSRFDKLPGDVQDKLKDSELNVEKLRYADSKGIDSEEWYTVHKAAKEHEKELGRKTAWVTAEAISKTVKGSDEEKLKALEAEFLPNDDGDKNPGKRSSVVRRYNAAINAGISWDEWTEVEKAVSAAGANWGATSGKYSGEYYVTKALRAAGYSKSQAAYIWSVYEKTDKETNNFSVYDYFFVDAEK